MQTISSCWRHSLTHGESMPLQVKMNGEQSNANTVYTVYTSLGLVLTCEGRQACIVGRQLSLYFGSVGISFNGWVILGLFRRVNHWSWYSSRRLDFTIFFSKIVDGSKVFLAKLVRHSVAMEAQSVTATGVGIAAFLDERITFLW